MAAASIDHPNVIPILDAGEEDGVLYITMRLVEGTDLRALLAADGALQPARAARIIRQVGGALDAAHARGLVHRDIKPANVLLARGDHVYLSDFGLAKRADEAGGLTRQGSIVARAEYVAPEQILEDRVDARSDVYALGCLLYEAITGEAPYAQSRESPLLAHLNAPPPSPLSRRPALPRGFDDGRQARDGQGSERALRRRRAISGRRRWSPPASSAGRARSRSSPPGGLRPLRPCPACRARSSLSPPTRTRSSAAGHRGEALRWAVALGVLAVLAVAMIVALNALSTL